MKASLLMKQLETLITEHGDHDVLLPYTYGDVNGIVFDSEDEWFLIVVGD